jgi:hypothetical protein
MYPTLSCATLQILHFELTLILLLVLFRYYVFGIRVVVPFSMDQAVQWKSQDLSSREIQHQL